MPWRWQRQTVAVAETRGRRRTEDSRPDLVQFIRTYMASRGQFQVADGHRLRDTCETYDCPVRAIAKKAKEMGWPCSASGIYNLFSKPRENSTSSACGGVIDSRPCAPTNCERFWHARMFFSSVKVKYACDFTDLAAKSRVAITRRYHGDAMCTVAQWAPASRGGRLGL